MSFLSTVSKRRPTLPSIPKLFHLPSFLGRKTQPRAEPATSQSEPAEKESAAAAAGSSEGRILSGSLTHDQWVVKFKSNDFSGSRRRPEEKEEDNEKPKRSISATSLVGEVSVDDSYFFIVVILFYNLFDLLFVLA